MPNSRFFLFVHAVVLLVCVFKRDTRLLCGCGVLLVGLHGSPRVCGKCHSLRLQTVTSLVFCSSINMLECDTTFALNPRTYVYSKSYVLQVHGVCPYDIRLIIGGLSLRGELSLQKEIKLMKVVLGTVSAREPNTEQLVGLDQWIRRNM